MVKPHAVADNHVGGITKMIEEGGFRIVAMKKLHLTAAQAGKFYEVHAERPFYGELCEMMSAGPIVAMILEKENAVVDFRSLIGATDPAEAAENTTATQGSFASATAFFTISITLLIRALFATEVPPNLRTLIIPLWFRVELAVRAVPGAAKA